MNLKFLNELDKLLKKYYEIFGSKNKLSKVLKARGVCLTTGEMYGNKLAKTL